MSGGVCKHLEGQEAEGLAPALEGCLQRRHVSTAVRKLAGAPGGDLHLSWDLSLALTFRKFRDVGAAQYTPLALILT